MRTISLKNVRALEKWARDTNLNANPVLWFLESVEGLGEEVSLQNLDEYIQNIQKELAMTSIVGCPALSFLATWALAKGVLEAVRDGRVEVLP